MGKVKVVDSSKPERRRIRPALTPEGREKQLESLAFDLAEKQLLEGTASSQVITHFLKSASIKANLEMEKIKHETELLRAKAKREETEQRSDEIYMKVLNAMRSYQGVGDPDDEYED